MLTLDDVKKLNIPKEPGSYQYYDSSGNILYVGKANDLRNRVLSYWQKSAGHSPAKFAMMKLISEIRWVTVDSEIEALLLEANLIKKYKPPFNVDLMDDKRHIYIKVASEQVPRVYATRQISPSGIFFGPFVSTLAVKETLRAIRKIWPYRSCVTMPKRVCLYYDLNKCPGMCEYPETREEYKKNVKQIIAFLQGKKSIILKEKQKEIDALGKKAEKEGLVEREEAKLMNLKYQVMNMKHVLEHTKIINLIDKYEADVVELAKVLGLAKVPDRIEGYDISNIFGHDAVGSMVVFKDGEPDKNEYRKFKIRLSEGMASDTFMLREVLERRLKHSITNGGGNERLKVKNEELKDPSSLRIDNEDEVLVENDIHNPQVKGEKSIVKGQLLKDVDYWPLPDLIIIDGGKGQLNTVVKVLKKFGLDIPTIAVSKGEGLRSAKAPDKIFFPGEKEALRLPLASPALHIIKRVRDEAHRFAITYHRNLRSKRWRNDI